MELDSYSANEKEVARFFARQDGQSVGESAGRSIRPTVDLPRHGEGERFVRGPIPLEWMKLASHCGYRSVAVSLLLWYAAGLQRSNPVKLSRNILAELKVPPKTAKRVLRRMAEIGLVKAEFKRGRSPVVTITTPPPHPD